MGHGASIPFPHLPPATYHLPFCFPIYHLRPTPYLFPFPTCHLRPATYCMNKARRNIVTNAAFHGKRGSGFEIRDSGFGDRCRAALRSASGRATWEENVAQGSHPSLAALPPQRELGGAHKGKFSDRGPVPWRISLCVTSVFSRGADIVALGEPRAAHQEKICCQASRIR